MASQATATAQATETSSTTEWGPRAKQLLVLLYNYVAHHGPSHPLLLLPAVSGLREAVQLYSSRDFQNAYQRGVAVYNLLLQSRQAATDLPLP
jgi:hypothetical protein